MSETIAAHLNVHFSGDADLPDLSTWEGFNTPQRVYQSGGGDGLIFWANQSGGVITDVTLDNNSDGQGYTYPPVLTLVTLPADDPTTVAELRPVMGEATGCSHHRRRRRLYLRPDRHHQRPRRRGRHTGDDGSDTWQGHQR